MQTELDNVKIQADGVKKSINFHVLKSETWGVIRKRNVSSYGEI